MKRKNTSGSSAEIDAIHEREMRDLGIVSVDEPSEVVQAFSHALQGETPASGADSGWVLIGGIKMGSKASVRTPLGQPMFEMTLTPAPGTEADGIYPVLVKRGSDDQIERLTIDFTRTLEYSNLSEKPFSKEETVAALQQLVKMGGWKAK
jgi:hypothetical protein